MIKKIIPSVSDMKSKSSGYSSSEDEIIIMVAPLNLKIQVFAKKLALIMFVTVLTRFINFL